MKRKKQKSPRSNLWYYKEVYWKLCLLIWQRKRNFDDIEDVSQFYENDVKGEKKFIGIYGR